MVAKDMLDQPLAAGDLIIYSQPMGAGSAQHIALITDVEYRRPVQPWERGRNKTKRCDAAEAYFFYLQVKDIWVTRRVHDGKPGPAEIRAWVKTQTRQLRTVAQVVRPDQNVVKDFLIAKGVTSV